VSSAPGQAARQVRRVFRRLLGGAGRARSDRLRNGDSPCLAADMVSSRGGGRACAAAQVSQNSFVRSSACDAASLRHSAIRKCGRSLSHCAGTLSVRRVVGKLRASALGFVRVAQRVDSVRAGLDACRTTQHHSNPRRGSRCERGRCAVIAGRAVSCVAGSRRRHPQGNRQGPPATPDYPHRRCERIGARRPQGFPADVDDASRSRRTSRGTRP